MARDMVALKQILHCCFKVGALGYDEYQRAIDLPRLPPPGTGPPGTALTGEDLAAVIRACRADANPVKGLRDAAAITAAASSGVRRHELVAVETPRWT